MPSVRMYGLNPTYERESAMIRNIFILLPILFILAACGGKSADRVVSEVDSLATANPQKALILIDSIEKSNDLNESQRMSIVWNRSIAHKALGMSL